MIIALVRQNNKQQQQTIAKYFTFSKEALKKKSLLIQQILQDDSLCGEETEEMGVYTITSTVSCREIVPKSKCPNFRYDI